MAGQQNNHAAANNPCLSASRSAKLPRVEDQKRQTAGQVLERPPSPTPFLNERPSHTRACVLCLLLHPPLQCPIQPNPHIGCDYASNSLHKHDRHFQQWRAKHRRHCGPVDKQARKQALQRLVQVEQQHTQAREIREQKVPEVYQFVFSLSHPDPTFTCCFLFLFSFLWR